MKNIVTIDFDIIMEPDINLYNNFIEDDITINDMIKEHKLLENIKADLYIYEYLTRYLMKVIKRLQPENIFFIEEHDTLVKLIEKDSFHLYNIDHHHDIAYNEDNISLPLINCNCGDWVKFLIDSHRVLSYTWISNDNSVEPGDPVKDHYKYDQRVLKEYNLDKLAENTDTLIICRSSSWLPEYYFPLFDAWIAICEEYYNETFHII